MENSSSDQKLKNVSEERTKLARQLKDTQEKLRRTEQEKSGLAAEVERLKQAANMGRKASGIAQTQSKKDLRETDDLRKSLNSKESQLQDLRSDLRDYQQKVGEQQRMIEAMQHSCARVAEMEAEADVTKQKLEQAQEAIISSTTHSYDNEVKLHQARAALHLILKELSSPAQQELQQQIAAAAGIAQLPAGLPQPPASTSPRYRFHYSPLRNRGSAAGLVSSLTSVSPPAEGAVFASP